MKKVLILCTGNSCRSIIAEALVNAKLEGVEAYSAGVRASKKVNAYAKRVLEEEGIWKDSYHSKALDEVLHVDFDLVVTVCDHANETCPMFPRPLPKIHVGFSDPDGKDYGAFVLTYQAIEAELLPIIQAELNKEKAMKIEVLGMGCSKCQALMQAVKEAVAKSGKFAQIDKVEDSIAIMNYGVMSTPALVIDGVVKSSGKVLSVDEIVALLA